MLGRFLGKFRFRYLVAALVLVVVVIVARKTVFKAKVEYETARVEVKAISEVLEVSGKVAADQKAILKFQTGGKLAWVGVKQGQEVKKWQGVANLDKSILEREVRKALSDYMHQRWDFEQIREDNKVTTDNYDQYTLTNKVRRLIEQEQFLLDKTVTDTEIRSITSSLATLASPIRGVVTRIDTPVAGVNVTVSDVIEIVDPETLYFEAEIDEADIGRVEVDQEAEVGLEAFGNLPIPARVSMIDFAASKNDSGGTVFLAKLKFMPPEGKVLRLGMTGEAKIKIAAKGQALVVPNKAIKEKGGKLMVQVNIGKLIEDRQVETGLENNEETEILTGLQAGDEVILGEKKRS